MKRTGYNATTRQYTFHDSTSGVQYISAPGERYGTLLPAATANYVNPKLGPGRKETLQAYDRPVFFADDDVQAARTPSRSHKSGPKSPTSRSPTKSGSSRRHGHRHTRSDTFADFLPADLIDSAPPSVPKRAPRPPSPPKSAPADEKGHFRFTDEKGVEPVERHYPGDKRGTRDALRTTARVLGRSFTTVRGLRSHGQRRDHDHDGYVLV
jgi:hypothetical protein